MAAITLVQIDTNAQSSSSSAPTTTQFNLISLPDPSNDDILSVRDYILLMSPPPPPPPRQSSSRIRIKDEESKTMATVDIHEIQTVLPHSGKYASYFVGSRIISNPLLHISTRVDPLFFALAHFQRIMSSSSSSSSSSLSNDKKSGKADQITKWQPWDQFLDGIPSILLLALNLDPNLNIRSIHEVGQLSHILDVSDDMCGDDLLLCRFSEERTLQWLLHKFQRSVEALRVRLCERRRRALERKEESRNNQGGGTGAYSTSFNVDDAEEINGNVSEDTKIKETEDGVVIMDSTSLTCEEEHNLNIAGVQLICDYIPIEWRTKLCKEVGLDDMDWMGKKKPQQQHSSTTSTNSEDTNTAAGEKKRARAAWEGTIGQDDADALLQYTQGNSMGGKSSSSTAVGITPGKKSSVQEAKSVGLKKLAKVNTKGMKSLSSFFGAGGGKTKKTKEN